MNEQQARGWLLDLAATIDPGPPPIDAVTRRGEIGDRRRVRAVATAVALAAMVALVAVLIRPQDDGPPRPVGPVDPDERIGTWWTPGALHVAGTTLAIDDPDDERDDVGWMIDVPDGVVVARTNGLIEHADLSGVTTLLDTFPTTKHLGPSFQRDSSDGRIAWTDGRRIVVYDPATGDTVERPGDAGSFRGATAWLIAFDRGRVYWDNSLGDRVWDVTTGQTTSIGPGASYLFDVRAGAWAVVRGDEGGFGVIRDQTYGSPPQRLPDGLPTPGFSPDGSRIGLLSENRTALSVATTAPTTDATAVSLRTPPGRLAATTWRGDDTVVVVLAPPLATTDATGERRIATCSATTGACRVVLTVTAPVVLAGEPTWELPPLDER